MEKRAKWIGILLLVGMALMLCPASGFSATHLGVNPSSMVTLVASALAPPPTDQWIFRRLLPDGTVEANEFVVPKKKVLIITDIDYTFTSPYGVSLRNGPSGVPFYTLGDTIVRDHFTGGLVTAPETSVKIVVPTNTSLGLTVMGYLAGNK